MEETRIIKLTAEENSTLADALYFARVFVDEVIDELSDCRECFAYKSVCKSRERFMSLTNRLYPCKLGGEADEK